MTPKFIMPGWNPDAVAALIALPYTTERGAQYPHTDLSTSYKVYAAITDDMFVELMSSLGKLAATQQACVRHGVHRADDVRTAAVGMLWSILKFAGVLGMSQERIKGLDSRTGFLDPPYTTKAFQGVDLSDGEKVFLFGCHRIVIHLTQQMGRLSWTQIRHSDGLSSRQELREKQIVANAMYALTQKFIIDVLGMTPEDISDALSLVIREE